MNKASTWAGVDLDIKKRAHLKSEIRVFTLPALCSSSLPHKKNESLRYVKTLKTLSHIKSHLPHQSSNFAWELKCPILLWVVVLPPLAADFSTHAFSITTNSLSNSTALSGIFHFFFEFVHLCSVLSIQDCLVHVLEQKLKLYFYIVSLY